MTRKLFRNRENSLAAKCGLPIQWITAFMLLFEERTSLNLRCVTLHYRGAVSSQLLWNVALCYWYGLKEFSVHLPSMFQSYLCLLERHARTQLAGYRKNKIPIRSHHSCSFRSWWCRKIPRRGLLFALRIRTKQPNFIRSNNVRKMHFIFLQKSFVVAGETKPVSTCFATYTWNIKLYKYHETNFILNIICKL